VGTLPSWEWGGRNTSHQLRIIATLAAWVRYGRAHIMSYQSERLLVLRALFPLYLLYLLHLSSPTLLDLDMIYTCHVMFYIIQAGKSEGRVKVNPRALRVHTICRKLPWAWLHPTRRWEV